MLRAVPSFLGSQFWGRHRDGRIGGDLFATFRLDRGAVKSIAIAARCSRPGLAVRGRAS
jgi:hypothetical protein